MQKIYIKASSVPVWLISKTICCCISAYLFFAGSATAQRIDFEHISSKEGLSQNMVLCLFQDQKGFIWVGTKDGLNRYDGYQFITYRYDPFDSLSISNNAVHQILEDNNGRMWVVTEGGVHLFDRENEVFYLLNVPASVNNLSQDAQGNLWQGGHREGILQISLPAGEKTLKTAKTTWLSTEDKVQRIFTTPVWLNNGNGLAAELGVGCYNIHYNKENKHYQLNRDFSPESNAELKQYIENLNGTKNRMEGWLLPGTGGKVWSANSDFLCSWDAEGNINKIPIPKEYAEFKPLGFFWNGFIHLLEDRNGRVWLGGFNSDFLVDVKEKTVRCISPAKTDTEHPLYSGTAASIEDRGNVVWLGTQGKGLVKFNDKAHRFADGLWKGQSIRCIYQTSDGWLWLGTNVHYLYARNPQTGKMEQMAKGNLFNNSTLDYVNCFYEDKNKTLWVGTPFWGLLKITNWKSGNPHYEAITEAGGVRWDRQNEPKQILEDNAGMFWVIGNSELRRFDPVTLKVQQYPLFNGDEARAAKNLFPCLYLDQSGRLWIGTSNEGLWLFNQEKGTFTKYQTERRNPASISSDVIKCIVADPVEPDRYLWIGTGGGGLNRFDTKTGVFERFLEKDGLIDLTVYGVLPDKMGNLWLSSNKGLTVFNHKTRSFRHFKQNEGLQDLEFNTCAYYKAPDGQMFFGGIGGYNAFYPEKILVGNDHVPTVVFTAFKIANRLVSHKTPGSPLKTAVAYAKQIILEPDVKVFSFDFAALDYSASADNQYMCKLEGFDPDWQYLGNVHTVTYTNLNPGKYTLHVRGTNNDGVWSDQDAVIELIICAPWWATWWAWLLYLLTAAGILFAFWQQQKKRIKADTEAQRQTELNNAKTRFFANISHELRTPLTLLLGPIQTLQKDKQLMPNQARLLEIAEKSGKQLEQLVNEILDLRKLEQGRMAVQKSPTNLPAFVGTYAAQFESLAERKAIDFAIRLPDSGTNVLLDREKVRQVLFNLLSNAFKFTPKNGRIELTVSIEGGILLLSVSDNGTGIHAVDLPYVFDRYFQSGAPNGPAEGGTGIGLALCKEYMQLFGGNIRVESVYGSGSVFIASFPVEACAATDELPATDRTEKAETVTAPVARPTALLSEKPTLLVVEDNFELQDYIKAILQEKYHVLTADNGQAALDALAVNSEPSLIITDLMMPVMDGYQLLEKLKSEDSTRHIPVIMLTARAELEDKLKALRIGVDDYIIKPFDEEELLVRIENLLQNQAARQQEVVAGTKPETARPLMSQPDREWLETFEAYVQKHYSSDILSVTSLAYEFAMSESTLLRQLKRLTGLSPLQYIQEVRLNEAHRLLETRAMNSIAQVASRVGYDDTRTFTRSFKQRFGKLPSKMMEA